ncbi:hypothetical protein Sango_0356200 [Sesamum angolense]|uniref:HAT C-terminal dimerisation domain-containing protein n=1 Tax=Sesamum angolense TaxID=2727404 RepID=A0AAE1X9G5_9LAMI|nr:hypothetical protein Sango_0356200 [Sesamum angolense]
MQNHEGSGKLSVEKHALRTSMSREFIDHVHDVNSPKQVWDTLERLFSKKNTARLQFLENELAMITGIGLAGELSRLASSTRARFFRARVEPARAQAYLYLFDMNVSTSTSFSIADSTSPVMQSEEETLEQTTSATNEEMTNIVYTDTIDTEENVTNKDDENFGPKPKQEAEEFTEKRQQNQPHNGLLEIKKEPKIEFTWVITGHWIDESLAITESACLTLFTIPLQASRGLEIANAIWRCLEDWGIEKLDSKYEMLAAAIKFQRRLPPRFADRRLHLIFVQVQKTWTQKRKKALENDIFIRTWSQNTKSKLINTRRFNLLMSIAAVWIQGGTQHKMLAAAIKFKDVFPRSELHYDICPSAEDWTKAEKVCSVLELFWTATHIVLGSDYPTSNLFLNEVSRVKVLLDKKALENDIFIRDMVAKTKSKFDKYSGDSNLLMSIAAVLDPRCKLRKLELCFPRLYSSENVERQIIVVRKTLYELYSEYVAISNIEDDSIGEGQINKLSNPNLRHVKLNVVGLTISITTVASEATFSAGSRVIDKYRALLTSDTVQVLMCGGDWLRKRFGVKKKPLSDKKAIYVNL